MKRYLVIGAVLMLLGLPVASGAQSIDGMNCRSWDDTGCMPSWWTPTPQASHTIDSKQLVEFLLQKGLISPQELALLQGGEAAQAKASTQPCAASQSVSR